MKNPTQSNDSDSIVPFLIKVFGASLLACLVLTLYEIKTIDSHLGELGAIEIVDRPNEAEVTVPVTRPSSLSLSPSPSTATTQPLPAHLADCIFPLDRKDPRICIQHINLEVTEAPDSSPKLHFSIRSLIRNEKIAGRLAVSITTKNPDQKTLSLVTIPSGYHPQHPTDHENDQRLAFQASNYTKKTVAFPTLSRAGNLPLEAQFYLELEGDPDLLVFKIPLTPANNPDNLIPVN